jgi:Rps23 Pro-64 3,4-dihydroxylase Tpa1-like proline 4-hydroxylase
VDHQATSSGIGLFAEGLVRSEEPFPHFAIPAILAPGVADQVLAWFQDSAPWRLRVESFYEQYEFSLISEDNSELAHELAGETVVEAARQLIREHFAVHGELALVDVSAHKLTPGQTIRIHNDWIGGEETHRVLIQLNDGWFFNNGGLLMLFGSRAPEDVRSVIEPSHGSGFAFEISERSFHAVSTIKAGQRFTLVYTFRDNA